MKTVIGIDYSITSPAICVYEGGAETFAFDSCQFYSLSNYDILSRKNLHFFQHKTDYIHDTHRFDQISGWVLDCLEKEVSDPNDVEVVGIEDYSMGSKGKVFNIAENCGLLKYHLWLNGYDFALVAPTVVKKFATGKGNATKDKMVEQFQKDTKIDLQKLIQPTRKLGSPTTDIVDSFYICKYFVTGSGSPTRET